jgi:SAM-dependent methyltransferase
VTELILERIRGAREAMVVGLDMSSSALRDAAAKVAGVRDALVEFVQARAEEMSRTVRRAADAVIFCNGIHYIVDKRRLLREVHETLRPGGVFAFNTSFFEGAQPPETRRFYRHWMIKCLRKLKEEYDLSPTRDRVEARHQLAPEDYRTLLEENGFEIREEQLVAARCPASPSKQPAKCSARVCRKRSTRCRSTRCPGTGSRSWPFAPDPEPASGQIPPITARSFERRGGFSTATRVVVPRSRQLRISVGPLPTKK